MSNTETPARQVLKKLKALWADSRSYAKRMLYAGAVMLALSFTFIFFGPLEMVAFGGNALAYTYKEVLLPLTLAALTVFVVGTLLIPLLRGKFFNYIVCALFSFTLCGYLQAAILNGKSITALTGDGIVWSEYQRNMFIGLGIWLVILLGLFFVMYLHRKLWSGLMMLVSLALVVMQVVPTIGILFGGYKDTEIKDIGSYALTEEGMYEYASEDNIFVFVLDRLDYFYIEQLLDENPNFFESMDGFTAYTNATSVFARTQPALNHMLTGSDELAYMISDTDYYARSWTEGNKNILGDLQKQGYVNRLYSNIQYLFSDVEYVTEHIDNVSSGRKEGLQQIALLKKMLNLSTYRYAPTVFKPFFYADTNYYNDVFLSEGVRYYSFNDVGYAPGFTTAVVGEEKKNFHFYHFNGSHPPYNLKGDGTVSIMATTAKEQTMGTFNNLFAAFARMKELGIYKDATIIITADHGAAIDDSKPVSKATRIGLFYKPAGSADTPLIHSAAQVSTENIPATLLKAAGADYTAYGDALDDIAEEQEVSRTYIKSISGQSGQGEYQIYKYKIVGDAADFDNWQVTEVLDIDHSFY